MESGKGKGDMRCTERCPECPSRNLALGEKPKNVVSGDWDGDDEYPHVLFVGEKPGIEENNRHRVFIGQTGEEFNNTYLPLAGLSRDRVSITNAMKCYWVANSGDTPPPSIVKSCAEFHLRRELDYHSPNIIVLMGGTANSLCNLDVEIEHGLVRKGSLLGWGGYIYSTFHPALGLHMPSKMKALLDDFRNLRGVINGEVQPLKNNQWTDFMRISDPYDVKAILTGPWFQGDYIAVDTESKKSWRGFKSTIKYTPWCISFSMNPHSAFMVKVEDVDAIHQFITMLDAWNPSRVIFHNAAYDWNILDIIKRGVGLEECKRLQLSQVQDTMAMAYHDGRVPKGLKALGYRHLGIDMQSFDEVVVPYSRNVALDYLCKIGSVDWPVPKPESTGALKERVCTDCKGKGVVSIGMGKNKKTYKCDCDHGKGMAPVMSRKQGINQKINRLFGDMEKGIADGTKPVDIWERWGGWVEKEPLDVIPVIQKYGAIPLPSIEYVPEAEAVQYACLDANVTLRLFPILKQRLTKIRRSVR